MNGINAEPAQNLNAAPTADLGTDESTAYVNRGDLPYDNEDFGLSLQELQSKFAGTGEHEFYTISEWRAVGTETLTNGYWDWVMSCIKKDDDAY